MSAPSDRFRALAKLPLRELEHLMRRGETPDFERMAGWEYRGQNRPDIIKVLGIQKFIKGFYRDETGMDWGYNAPVRQNGPAREWIAKPSDDRPRRFGFYRVRPVDPRRVDNVYLNALFLDYSEGPGWRWDPTRTLRDYVVRIEPGSDDLLLGAARVALGPLRVATNYFLLERHRETRWRPGC